MTSIPQAAPTTGSLSNAGAPPATHSTPLVEVKNLTVEFPTEDGPFRAVDGIDLHIRRGETLAIVGESGSGKSVTALSLMRLIEFGGGRIVGGSIQLAGRDGGLRDLAQESLPAMNRLRGDEIAMIFQEPMTSLNPVFTIGDQIAEAVMLHQGLGRKEARSEALAMLNKVRIPEAARLLDRYPHQLSGGMRQRVMIAMALSCRPSLLIADEPTTALDVTIQAQILRLVRQLQDEMGMAVMFITHDMGVVAEVADRVLVMYRGKKVEEGVVDDVFARPQAPYTKALLAAVPKLGSLSGAPLPRRFPVLTVEGEAGIATEAERWQDTVEPAAPPILDVDDLFTRFEVRRGLFGRLTGRIHAVERVSFKVHPGETLALVGESGCGKSTAGRTIMQLQAPDSGSIRFSGRDIFAMPEAERRRMHQKIQYIFQDPYASLNPRVTVGFSIAEPLITHNLAKGAGVEERVAQLLVDVGLSPDHAKRYPHEFSGGQRQRICIARALACEPDLIIADEAVSALDVSIQAQIVNLLMDLQEKRRLAYLFISHDMAVVERVSHRVAVMYLGQIVEIGPRQAVFENPQHAYTRRLMAAVPIADPARRDRSRPLLEGEIPSPMRKLGDEPIWAPLVEVEPGHFVARHPVGDFA
ncbi:dipeptide ABC transporter ATP-binding protein [Consotaella salsifontis]|uniref:Glutathione import ATP-binding protein GsiA n=1 Tax=Consotaella salsifontis TaxID=1365950 RepID=A0A1T4SFY9_9HYPH|nr:dipeptide ABC transporter ATP-binding protein [Consotaella salsifontis]SKA27073.1 glutathione transport system ATP-binding protein [Consotaella salsifontis]